MVLLLFFDRVEIVEWIRKHKVYSDEEVLSKFSKELKISVQKSTFERLQSFLCNSIRVYANIGIILSNQLSIYGRNKRI